jgi:formylglycine-generating enzyme required for sulfatase activity
MGSDQGERDELPLHEVTVPSFEILRTEVTVAQYGECVEDLFCSEPGTDDVECNWDGPGYSDHPVNCVDWFAAGYFCAWAEGRLPTEAEWEYAARSEGRDIRYPWGNVQANCVLAVIDNGVDGCGTGRTWPVCSKPTGNTAQGLCGLSGNVYEWLQDWYQVDYIGAPTDGSAWEDSGRWRARRGSSFTSPDSRATSTNRSSEHPDVESRRNGIRCARDAP